LKDERIQTDEAQYAIAAAILEKNLARIKVARKHLTRRGMRIE
jgi:hypothetical protein